MNSVSLTGRLTKDPELKKTQSGLSNCTFTLAVDRNTKRSDQSNAQTADFIQCVAWRQSADYLCNYGHKGDKVGIEGKIQTRNYDDKYGQKKYVTEVIANHLELLSSRPKGNTGQDLNVAPMPQDYDTGDSYDLPW